MWVGGPAEPMVGRRAASWAAPGPCRHPEERRKAQPVVRQLKCQVAPVAQCLRVPGLCWAPQKMKPRRSPTLRAQWPSDRLRAVRGVREPMAHSEDSAGDRGGRLATVTSCSWERVLEGTTAPQSAEHCMLLSSWLLGNARQQREGRPGARGLALPHLWPRPSPFGGNKQANA